MDEIHKLNNLVAKSHTVLISINTVFPFDFFPDTIRVDENKVDIISRDFFSQRHIESILIKDLKTVKLSTGPIFATVTLDLNSPPRKQDDFLNQPISYLWKSDAIRFRRIVLGLIAASKEKIKVEKIPLSQLKPMVEQVGKAREFPKV